MSVNIVDQKQARHPNLYLGLFVLFSALNLLSNLFPDKVGVYFAFSKVLILPSLLGFFLLQTQSWTWLEKRFVVVAAIFSCLGDVLLMLTGAQFFLFGLAAFLVAQLSYILVFRRGPFSKKQKEMDVLEKGISLLLILYGLALFYVLWPHLGEMRIPVAVYALVIMGMGLAALSRRGKVSMLSFKLCFSGALLFILSDSIIALNRFAQDMVEIPYAGFWIMLTYIAAQYLIVKGIIEGKLGREG